MGKNNRKTAVIIGAGPAGLTAAYELLKKTNVKPIVFEMSKDIGGISKTVRYKGNRMDIGGHRFYTKSDRVMQWWLNIMPLQEMLLRRNSNESDRVMLKRKRLSRILFLGQFFDYPISLKFETVIKLGFLKLIKIGISYIIARIFPIKKEKSLEDFFINRFGKQLYLMFFKDYTEKVWGVPCSEISPKWGAQRIKNLSIVKIIIHALREIVLKDPSLAQKKIETSLIGQFIYPKYGPGQLWEEVAAIIKKKGGEIYAQHEAFEIACNGNKIISVNAKNLATGKIIKRRSDYLFSSMPVKDLIHSFNNGVPRKVRQVARGLMYRDFITVGLLVNKLKIKNNTKIKTRNDIVPDNWIYIQEKDVKIGRLQIFNNWSPYMVKDQNKVWIGLEYFCNEGDELWNMPEEVFCNFAIDELVKINIIDKCDVLDKVLIHVPKAYPAYFGTYDQFGAIRDFTDNYKNLFLIGRNGMHRYNNQDHSMLTAMMAVENIVDDIASKDDIWEINANSDYHEEK